MDSLFAAPWLKNTGWVVGAHRLSYSMACTIFSDQESKPCLLHWQEGSSPLSHQGSPPLCCFSNSPRIVTGAGLPWWSNGWESTLQCREHWFHPWYRKIPHAIGRLSLYITATWAHEPQFLKPTHLERLLCNEKTMQWEACALQVESSQHLPQRERAHAQQWRPRTATGLFVCCF